ncbi:MAG: type II secretion system protein [Pirellulaceae bacterium]
MSPHPRRSRGFTLVEILVVVAIIVILMAILIPTAMGMISKARNAAIGVEISQIATGFNEYKKEHGDYPPSMGEIYTVANGACYSTVAERHLLRCYPKMDPNHKVFFYNNIAPRLGNDESIVFWLAVIANDPRYPFKNLGFDNNGVFGWAPQPGTTVLTQYPGPYTRFVHFEFDERRLQDLDADVMPAYSALYGKDTPYVYFDSRTYLLHCQSGNAAVGNRVQPMTDGRKIANLSSSQPPSLPQKQDPRLQMFVNPNTFQVHCAGQDGEFGMVPNVFGGGFNWDKTKQFPGMANTNEEDSDNMADFTEGRKLIDHRDP